MQDGQTISQLETDVLGASGGEFGSIEVSVAMQTPLAGELQLEVWIVDEAGNQSNTLVGRITAQ